MNASHFLDEMKEKYLFELDQKDKINTKVTIPIGVITLFIGSIIYFLKDISEVTINLFGILFFVFFTFFIISICINIIFIVLSYYNYKYKTIPSAVILDQKVTEIRNYYDINYEQYFKQNGSKEDLIKEDINSHMYDYYLNASTVNSDLNAKKNKYLRYSGYTIVISLILIVFTLTFHQLSFKEKPTEIKLIKEIKEEKENVKTQPKPTTTQANPS